MRIIYLIAAVLITFFGLLVSFSNVNSRYPFQVLLSSFNSMPLTLPLLLMMIVGAGAGVFFTLYFLSKQDSSGDDSVF